VGLALGIAAGLVRVLFFLYSEHYSAAEVWYFTANYFRNGVNPFVLYGAGLGLALAVVWILFDRMEGLIVSGLVVALPFLPMVYFVNKNYFPGRYEPVSLVGNGLFFLTMAGLTFLLFFRWLRNLHFLVGLNQGAILWASVVVAISINLAYFFQPDVKRLQSVPPEPAGLIRYFDEYAIGFSAASNGTPDNAEEVLQKHFSEVARQRRAAVVEKIMRRDPKEIFQIADAVLRREFTFLHITKSLDKPIDWHRNPTGDREWLLALNRLDWMWELAAAYHLTGEKKYAAAFEDYMTDWLNQNPVSNWKNESDDVWRLIESSARITDSWLDAFAILFDSNDVTPTLKWRMLASFHAHAQFLAHFRSPRRNHLLQETYGLLAVAAAFPEFKMSRDWLDIAKFRLDRAMRTDVYPDGGYNEGSTFYHRFAIRILQQVADCAATYGVKLSDYFHVQLEKMYEFLLYTSRPDGVMPQMNDGFHAKNLRILFEQPATMFSRADFEYFASGGTKGERPACASKAFPFSGVYVMRSDWSSDARYMIVDAGMFGSAHGHEDKLSFEVFALGQPFIVESGTYTYVPGKWRKFFTSSFAHNTVIVDGKSQMRALDEKRWLNDPPVDLPNTWHSNESFDFLEASYDQGYGNVKEGVFFSGVRHTRRFLFVNPDYWIVWDIVSGEGEHSVAQLLHFAPDCSVQLTSEPHVAVSVRNKQVGLQVLTLSGQPLSGRTFRGEEAPVQGWVSPRYGLKLQATTVSFEISGKLPAVVMNILLPWQGFPPEVTAELLPVNVDGATIPSTDGIAVRIATGLATDYLLIAPGVPGRKSFSGITTESEILLIRRFPDGREIRREMDKISLLQR